ncbi:hypothetical protein EZS27_000350 [termite gut metagenome]|uniref:Uncharacterized protein n=1 Tax=termite gut metagenome TaxID=433724 RepID=A0A5J4T4H2_9ZZZZ
MILEEAKEKWDDAIEGGGSLNNKVISYTEVFKRVQDAFPDDKILYLNVTDKSYSYIISKKAKEADKQ